MTGMIIKMKKIKCKKCKGNLIAYLETEPIPSFKEAIEHLELVTCSCEEDYDYGDD